MKLSEIMNKLDLQNINKKPVEGDRKIESGYACDLLSQVLAVFSGGDRQKKAGVAFMQGILDA